MYARLIFEAIGALLMFVGIPAALAAGLAHFVAP